jgi:hypothetical protein
MIPARHHGLAADSTAAALAVSAASMAARSSGEGSGVMTSVTPAP